MEVAAAGVVAEEGQPTHASDMPAFPLSFKCGLALPYLHDGAYPEIDLDYGLRRGFLLHAEYAADGDDQEPRFRVRAHTASNYAQQQARLASATGERVRDDPALERCTWVFPRTGVELALMTPEPFLSLTESSGTPEAPVLNPDPVERLQRTERQLLARELVRSCAGVDFTPSVVAELINMKSHATTDLPSGAEGHFEYMTCVPSAAGYPSFLVYVFGIGRNTIRLCPLGKGSIKASSLQHCHSISIEGPISQICAVNAQWTPEGILRPFVAVITLAACHVFSIKDDSDCTYILYRERSIPLPSLPVALTFLNGSPDLAIITCTGAVYLWEAANAKRVRVISEANEERATTQVGSWICTFGAHPRSILLARRNGKPELIRFNFALNTTTSDVFSLPKIVEQVFGMARHPYNPFHLVITTSQHVLLVDERVLTSSLLAWRHHMLLEPPSFVHLFQPTQDHLPTFIVVANETRGEILMFQYAHEYRTVLPSLANSNQFWEDPGLRSSVFSPNRPVGLPSILRSRRYFVPQKGKYLHDPVWSLSTTKFLPRNMLGFCAALSEEGNNVVLQDFQMTDMGDIFCQSFTLRSAAYKDDEASEESEHKTEPEPSLMWDQSDLQLISDTEFWDKWMSRFDSRYGLHDDPEKVQCKETNMIKLLQSFIKSEHEEMLRETAPSQTIMSEAEEKLRDRLRNIISYIQRGPKTVFDIDWFLKTEFGLHVGPQEIMRFMQKVFGTAKDKHNLPNEQAYSRDSGSHEINEPDDNRQDLFERLFCARSNDCDQDWNRAKEFNDFERILASKAKLEHEHQQKHAMKERRKVQNKAQKQKRQVESSQQLDNNVSSFSLFPSSTPFSESSATLSEQSPLSFLMQTSGFSEVKSQVDSEEEEEYDKGDQEEDYYQKGLGQLAEKWRKREIQLRHERGLPIPGLLSHSSQRSDFKGHAPPRFSASGEQELDVFDEGSQLTPSSQVFKLPRPPPWLSSQAQSESEDFIAPSPISKVPSQSLFSHAAPISSRHLSPMPSRAVTPQQSVSVAPLSLSPSHSYLEYVADSQESVSRPTATSILSPSTVGGQSASPSTPTTTPASARGRSRRSIKRKRAEGF